MCILFTRNDADQRLKNRFVWFRKWILERQTFKNLSRDSALSVDTLQRTFYAYLKQSPKVKIIKRSNVHLRIDATYFEEFCMVCYQDNDDGYTQLIRFTNGEHFEEIKEDLDNLIKLGVQIESITIDGHKSILKAIKKSLPNVLALGMFGTCTKNVFALANRVSKDLACVELRGLILMLLRIKTDNDRIYWTALLEKWYQQHKVYLQEKINNVQTGRYWYTHKLLRRSYFTIKRALPNMFHYLSNPKFHPRLME